MSATCEAIPWASWTSSGNLRRCGNIAKWRVRTRLGTAAVCGIHVRKYRDNPRVMVEPAA